MKIQQRIDSFLNLGIIISKFIQNPESNLLKKIRNYNPWFIPEFTLHSLQAIYRFLTRENMLKWLAKYDLNNRQAKNIGLAPAGNIPLAGFHDLLCVLVSGHNVIIKPSHQDRVLLNFIIHSIANINPDVGKRIKVTHTLDGIDAILASGSDNTARYFEYYFRNIPGIIRKNRTSIAVLSGNESRKELTQLADDVFLYFGLGCRNVSKLFIPTGFNLHLIPEAFGKYSWIVNHGKYRNNFLHQKTLLKIDKSNFIDCNFFLLIQNNKTVSPISVVFYETYKNRNELASRLSENNDKIQTIVSALPKIKNPVNFGAAQTPDLWDYADGIDTMDFLLNL